LFKNSKPLFRKKSLFGEGWWFFYGCFGLFNRPKQVIMKENITNFACFAGGAGKKELF